MSRAKKRPKFKNLRALLSAHTEGALTADELDAALRAVEMGIGLSKRDKALGMALEETDEAKDGPRYWTGFRDGLAQGYEGARLDYESGTPLRPVAELIKEAEAEASTGDKN